MMDDGDGRRRRRRCKEWIGIDTEGRSAGVLIAKGHSILYSLSRGLCPGQSTKDEVERAQRENARRREREKVLEVMDLLTLSFVVDARRPRR